MTSSIDIGFIPVIDPCNTLNDYFSEWEVIGKNLHLLNTDGKVVDEVNKLPLLDHTLLKSIEEFRYVYVLLSMISHSYLKWNPSSILPKQLAVPFWYVSKQIGILPVATHAGLDLWNFRTIDKSKSRTLDNIIQNISFTGTKDEKYFNLIMTEIEEIGSHVFNDLRNIPYCVKDKNEKELIVILEKLDIVLTNINISVSKMHDGCKPEVFYHVIRPYLAGWHDKGLIFEGVSEEPTKFKGGSAAQSSLIQLIDIVLGVYHESPFFKEMREYMPKDHSDILYDLEKQMHENNIYEFIMNKKYVPISGHAGYKESIHNNFSEEGSDDSELKSVYKKCVKKLSEFRSKHFAIAHKYVVRMCNAGVVKGTGGEDLKRFLKTARDETDINLT
jgi:indoleamine 2,3-dioxygenase